MIKAIISLDGVVAGTVPLTAGKFIMTSPSGKVVDSALTIEAAKGKTLSNLKVVDGKKTDTGGSVTFENPKKQRLTIWFTSRYSPTMSMVWKFRKALSSYGIGIKFV